jgi:hypothetical protein
VQGVIAAVIAGSLLGLAEAPQPMTTLFAKQTSMHSEAKVRFGVLGVPKTTVCDMSHGAGMLRAETRFGGH